MLKAIRLPLIRKSSLLLFSLRTNLILKKINSWTHPDLSTLSETDRRNEMYNNEAALKNIIGKFPTYMRPPYSSCTGACPTTMSDLGYHIIYFDVDTDDYDNDTPQLIVNAENNYNAKVEGTSPNTQDFLVIAHDIHQNTASTLVPYMLESIKRNGYKGMPPPPPSGFVYH